MRQASFEFTVYDRTGYPIFCETRSYSGNERRFCTYTDRRTQQLIRKFSGDWHEVECRRLTQS